jgi:MarR family transcriptional regulator for hemolysin
MDRSPRQTPELSLATYQAGLVQSRAYRALNKAYAEVLAVHSLSMTQWGLLGLLLHRDSVTHVEISTIFDVTPTMATKLVTSLEKQKWVKRQAHANDSRIKEVVLTSEGRTLVRSIEPRLRTKMGELLKGVSRKEMAAYLGVLAYLAEYDLNAQQS